MANPKLTLYVDVVSVFTYFAFHVINTSPTFAQCEVTYVPVLLGGIIKACGGIPPMSIKNKDKWINRERLRWSQSFHIPMAQKMPDGFPVPTLAVQRALVALTLTAPEKVPDVMAALCSALWTEGRQISKPEDFLPIFAGVIGEAEAREVLEKSTSDGIKKALMRNTEQALADGAFGLPWYVAVNREGEKECFWGFDRIGQVATHLGIEMPKAGESAERGWKAML